MNTSRELCGMSRQERQDALEQLVSRYVKEALFMDSGDELPLDQGFFDLGLTSLRLSEIRARLEAELDLDIDATVLFSRPTVDQLVSHLADRLSTPSADQKASHVR
ncbi:acyl carrier protein [Streptomyces alanosinicus]|nr:acyl carrier protein [Streptomyces alanosinicus]